MASSTPTAASHGELMNRMNMLLAKRSSNLNALMRTTASATTAGDASPKKPNAAQKQKSSFSAMKTSSAAFIPTATSKSQASGDLDDDDDDDDDDRLSSSIVNAGLGFVPAGKEVADDARTAATRDLRGKLLGKRAREQKEDAAAARRKKQRGRLDEEESDEDEGRSKIGKGRKKGKRAVVAEED